MSFLGSIKDAIVSRSGVQIVADDPDLLAELLLLVRLMFADGVLQGEERAALDTILEGSFGIPRQDIPDVMRFLVDFGYETSARQALEALADAPLERRENLVMHMAAIARADDRLHPRELAMLETAADRLGVGRERLAELLAARADGNLQGS